MKDICAVMMTVDRSPRRNYLPETLRAFVRSGVHASPRLAQFVLVDSGSSDGYRFMYDALPAELRTSKALLVTAPAPRSPTQNCSEALRIGALYAKQHYADWVLFIEDDIDACDDLIGSVGRWLDRHASDAYPLYTFGAHDDAVRVAAAEGYDSWRYPLGDWVGTTCVALRWETARMLSAYLHVNEQNAPRGCYDNLIGQCLREEEYTHVLASAPSFVQHVGAVSASGYVNGITYNSWRGPAWRYQPEAS